MLRFVVVVAALTLAGCDHSASDAAKCQGYGLEPGSEGFANCMVSYDQNRRAMGATIAAQNPYLRY